MPSAPSAWPDFEAPPASSTARCPRSSRSWSQEYRAGCAPERASLLKEEVDEEDIAKIVSRWTGIPVQKMLEGGVQKLIHMEERLHARVVGQDRPSRRSLTGPSRSRRIERSNRPIGSFIFLGRPAWGENGAGSRPGEFLFRQRAGMIRIDMSEYMEKHTWRGWSAPARLCRV